jgi:hypothetical protein
LTEFTELKQDCWICGLLDNALLLQENSKFPWRVFTIARPTAAHSTGYDQTLLYSRHRFEPKTMLLSIAMDKKETWLAHWAPATS